MSNFSEYPYTNYSDLNLDWVLTEIKKIREAVNNITDEAIKAAEAYVDGKLDDYKAEINGKIADLTNTVNAFTAEYAARQAQFEQTVDANLNLFQEQINQESDKLEAEIVGVNARTDYAIAQNNEYIFQRIDEGLIEFKVLNYFTGEYVSAQEMFDYLAQFHLQNSISYQQINAKNKTYNEIAALNATYTQLAVNGGSIIQ